MPRDRAPLIRLSGPDNQIQAARGDANNGDGPWEYYVVSIFSKFYW